MKLLHFPSFCAPAAHNPQNLYVHRHDRNNGRELSFSFPFPTSSSSSLSSVSVSATGLFFAVAILVFTHPCHHFADALTEAERANVPICPTPADIDYENAVYFGNGNVLLGFANRYLSSSSTCATAWRSAGLPSLQIAEPHAKFGILGNDQLVSCRNDDLVCRVPFQTGVAAFRKAQPKPQMMKELAAAGAANSLGRFVSIDSFNIRPTSSIYSPMSSPTPFVTSNAAQAHEVKINVELQQSFFEGAYRIPMDDRKFAVEFVLTPYATCEKASDNPRLQYVVVPTSSPAEAPNTMARPFTQEGGAQTSRTASVVKLNGMIPSIPSAWRDGMLTVNVPLVVCMRMATHKYDGSRPSNPVFGQWFSIPQFSGNPFHAIIASSDMGASWNTSYLPTISNPAVNRWDIIDTVQEAALAQLKASNPLRYTEAYLAVPRVGVPNPRRPLFNNVARILVSRATIDNSPWLFFAVDFSLDVCNVNTVSNFRRADLRVYNTTHYEAINIHVRPSALGTTPFTYGGANAALCGAAWSSGAVWMPVSTHTNFISRCPYGRAYVGTTLLLEGLGTDLDANSCFACGKEFGSTQLCAGRGVCGVKPVGYHEVSAPKCKCNDGDKWNSTLMCAVRAGQLTASPVMTMTHSIAMSGTISNTRPKNTLTQVATKTHELTHGTPSKTHSIALPLTCFWDVLSAPTVKRISSSTGLPSSSSSSSSLTLSSVLPVRVAACAVGTNTSACAGNSQGDQFLLSRTFFPAELLEGQATASNYSAAALAGCAFGFLLIMLLVSGEGVSTVFGGPSSAFDDAAAETERRLNEEAAMKRLRAKRRAKLEKKFLREIQKRDGNYNPNKNESTNDEGNRNGDSAYAMYGPPMSANGLIGPFIRGAASNFASSHHPTSFHGGSRRNSFQSQHSASNTNNVLNGSHHTNVYVDGRQNNSNHGGENGEQQQGQQADRQSAVDEWQQQQHRYGEAAATEEMPMGDEHPPPAAGIFFGHGNVAANNNTNEFIASPPTARSHHQYSNDGSRNANNDMSHGGGDVNCGGGNAGYHGLSAQTAAARDFDISGANAYHGGEGEE